MIKTTTSPLIGDSKFSSKAIDINDDTLLNNDERERQLKELFESEGIVLKFVGRFPRKLDDF